MKKALMMVVLAAAAALFAQDKTMSLAEARGKIGEVIAKPSTMTAIMKQLSAEDQKTFLADVNAAISSMPGSPEEKASKFVEANSAALRGAQTGNLSTLVAEVFATVPPESLTVVNEHLATEMFNRSADPSKTYTDAQFKDIAVSLLDKVQERTATADNAGVRNTFALLMLVRASNGTPADLRDTLIDSIKNEETRSLARNEWVGPALGDGQEKSYDPMLGSAEAGSQPDVDLVLSVPFAATGEALLADIASEVSVTDASASIVALSAPVAVSSPLVTDNSSPIGTGSGVSTLPRTTDPSAPYNPEYNRESSDYTE